MAPEIRQVNRTVRYALRHYSVVFTIGNLAGNGFHLNAVIVDNTGQHYVWSLLVLIAAFSNYPDLLSCFRRFLRRCHYAGHTEILEMCKDIGAALNLADSCLFGLDRIIVVAGEYGQHLNIGIDRMCAFLIRLRTGHIERILTSSHEADGIGFGHMCRQSTGEVVTAFTFIRPKPNIFKGLIGRSGCQGYKNGLGKFGSNLHYGCAV